MITSSDHNGATNSVKILRDVVKLRGVPFQGANFFQSYYPVFRGRGIILNSTNSSPFYGLFSSINSFFSATSVLYIGCEADGSHIEAGVLSPTVSALEAHCPEGGERSSVASWGGSLTRSLAQVTGAKNASKFRIELGTQSSGGPRDRDLVIHYLDNPFPPAPTPESVSEISKFITAVHSAGKRLLLGGFYVLATPVDYNGIDLLLSSIAATTTPECPLTYVGMILYGNNIPLWIFRIEPMSPAILESQRTMALARLVRYPPMLQAAIQRLMPESTNIGSGVESSFEDILLAKVTPTDTLSALFRVATGFYPREVLNRLGSFQPKYSLMIDSVRAITDLKIQVRIIMQLLYDLALASQRRCQNLRLG